jgi:hypothetical protein
VSVSERDRAYLERLGRYKATSHDEAQARHLARSLAERLRQSWALAEAHRDSARPLDDDPSPFYERARRLGLYEP